MNALAVWVRLDLRRRVRSLAVLSLLVALATATVMTAVAGARRGSTAVDRLLAETLPATIAVLPNEPGFDWDAVAAIPGVEAMARFPLSAFFVDGGTGEDVSDFVYADAAIMDTIERPVLLEGRMFDPTRADEAVITGNFEDSYGKGVGDTVTFELFTPEQIDAIDLGTGDEPPGGPKVETRIVGVVRSPWFSDYGDVARGRVIASPALYTEYEANFLGTSDNVYLNALIRLEGGGAAIPEFREHLADVSGRRDIDFFDLVAQADHANDVGGFEADSLLAFALAAAVASLFLVGQSVARFAAGTTVDLQVLRAFGLPPAQVRTGAAVGPFVAGVAGALLGAGTSIALSSRFPMGTVQPFEPSPGTHVDGLVLAVGVVLVPSLVGGGALLAAWRSAATAAPRRGSAVASFAARLGVPVPVALGTRFALERGRGAQSVPVRPALIGAVVGVLGVVAALTFADGVRDATANPARFGQVFELQSFLGFNGEDFLSSEALLGLIAADPDIAAVNDTRQSVAESGSVDLPVFSFDPVDEPLAVVITEGRLPAADTEIMVAPESASLMGASVGDTVELAGTEASGSYTISGIAFVPSGPHNDYDSGAWATRATYDELFDSGFKFHTGEIAVRPGADPDAVVARVKQTLVDELGDPSAADLIEVRAPPSRLAELKQVQRLPLFLAGFLAVLAIGAVGHALATAVRRRRHDLAVLRAVGVTRWQCRTIVVTQASLLALFGLAVGVPTGLALGRTLWRTVADNTPIDYVPPLAVWLLIVIAPAALLLANLLAAWPSQRAASIRVGHVLRTE